MVEGVNHPISYSDAMTGVNFTSNKYGSWSGKFIGFNGEIVEILLPENEQGNTPKPMHLALIRKVMNELPALRSQAVAFARQDVMSDFDKWGLVDENDVLYSEIYDDMKPWYTMTEAEYDAEFQLMGLTIQEATQDEFVLGFHSDVDTEHGVGIRFKNNRPAEVLSWCYFF